MIKYLKPPRLKKGDTIAILSPSWGGPSKFPHVYDRGLMNLQEYFGLRIKEYPTARMDAREIFKNPKARAEDINMALADNEISAVITSIGGDDSIRILKYLDAKLVAKHPKIILGYSDTTTILSYFNQLGLVTFNGPSIMAGFSQMDKFSDEFKVHIEQMLFNPTPTYVYKPYQQWSEGYPVWGKPENVGMINNPHKNDDGWHWLQGVSKVQGKLFGGCIDVFEFMKSTAYWPGQKFWDKKILFFETSSEYGAAPAQIKAYLRNYGIQGVFDHIEGLLMGRARDYTDEQKSELDKILVDVVSGEFGRNDLPIVSNMDFGHTDPQFILPLGIRAEVDCNKKTFGLLETPVV